MKVGSITKPATQLSASQVDIPEVIAEIEVLEEIIQELVTLKIPSINVVGTDDVIDSSETNTTITGTTSLDSAVTIEFGGHVRDTVVTDTTWSYTLTDADILAMGQGAETITATATDSFGNTATSLTTPESNIGYMATASSGLGFYGTTSLANIDNDNTSTSGANNYQVHPTNADGEHINFNFAEAYHLDTFTLYNRVNSGANGARIVGSTLEFFSGDVSLGTETITASSNIITMDISAYADVDSVRLTFDGEYQNFREIDFSGIPSSEAPRVIEVDAIDLMIPTINVVGTDDVIDSSETNTTITGTTSIDSSVTIEFGGHVRDTVVTDTTWSYTLTDADIFAMGQGAETIAVTATGPDGMQAETSRSIDVDTVSATPRLLITDNAINTIQKGEDITYTFNFDQEVNGFSAADISVANGAVSNFDQIDETTYTATVTPTDNYIGNLVVGVNAGVVTSNSLDAVNGNISATSLQAVDMSVNPQRGFTINGAVVNDHSGHAVSNAGDVNGDGLDDLLVGSGPLYTNGGEGSAYVVFGKTDGVDVELSDIESGTSDEGFYIEGAFYRGGEQVSAAGDVNGDGLDDLIIGSEYDQYTRVVFGKTTGTTVVLKGLENSADGFTIKAIDGTREYGDAVSGAGDVNGDGFDDLIVGNTAATVGGVSQVGKSYVVFGKGNGNNVDLQNVADGEGGYVINGTELYDHSGYSVAGAGDVNGDGLDDIMVGSALFDISSDGMVGGIDDIETVDDAYVVFGKDNTDAVDLTDVAEGDGGFIMNGAGHIGYSVSGAGDVNGDGLDDMVLSFGDEGQVYVVFGKDTTDAVDLSNFANTNEGFVVSGLGIDQLGLAVQTSTKVRQSGSVVSGAGDVNGDGYDDLLMQNPITGKSYVVFGKNDTAEVDLDVVASGIGGFEMSASSLPQTIEEGSFMRYVNLGGYGVSAAGDVNGDGLDDIIVSSSHANGTKGESYVVFGKTDTNAVDLSNLGADSRFDINHLGTVNDDTLVGDSADEIFVALAGDDTLTGNGGMDTFSAGIGDDTIIINQSNIDALEATGAGNRARVDGGGDVDILALDGAGIMLDFTAIANSRIQDIETIDITGSGDNTFELNLNDLLDSSSSTNILKVLGDSGDSVIATGFADSGTQATEDDVTYNVYTHVDANVAANAALWVETDLSVMQVITLNVLNVDIWPLVTQL